MATFLITGANRGIGLEMARQLSARGERVIATVRDPAKSGELKNHAAKVLPLDVSREAAIAELASAVGEPVDVLINNAGVSSEAKSINDLTMAEMHRVLVTNAVGPMLVCKAVLPLLRRGGRKTVVNISSQLASIANNSGGSSYPYRASKTTLNQLTVCLANELRPEGFCCVVVHPGWVRTDMGGPNAPMTPEESAMHLLRLIEGLTAKDSGRFLNYDGRAMPW